MILSSLGNCMGKAILRIYREIRFSCNPKRLDSLTHEQPQLHTLQYLTRAPKWSTHVYR